MIKLMDKLRVRKKLMCIKKLCADRNREEKAEMFTVYLLYSLQTS